MKRRRREWNARQGWLRAARWACFSLLAAAAIPADARGDPREVIEHLKLIMSGVFAEDTLGVDVDTNDDGRATAADLPAYLLVVFNPPVPTASPQPTSTPSPELTASATPSPRLTATPTGSATVTPTASRSSTPTKSPTPVATATPVPSATATTVGILFGGAIADLVPHAVNDRLEYRVTDPTGTTATEVGTVISVGPENTFVVDVVHSNAHETQSYIDSGSELTFVGSTNLVTGVRTTCTPPLPRLSTPMIAGAEVSVTARCELRAVAGNVYLGRFERTDTVTPVELLASRTVPAGTFAPVIRVDGSTTLGDRSEYYLTPGVGLIEERRTTISTGRVTLRQLTDGTIGGRSIRQ